jgi:hypothetical protein
MRVEPVEHVNRGAEAGIGRHALRERRGDARADHLRVRLGAGGGVGPTPRPFHAHAGVVADVVRVDPLLELLVAVARRGRRGAPAVGSLLSDYETSTLDESPPARN